MHSDRICTINFSQARGYLSSRRCRSSFRTSMLRSQEAGSSTESRIGLAAMAARRRTTAEYWLFALLNVIITLVQLEPTPALAEAPRHPEGRATAGWLVSTLLALREDVTGNFRHL